VLDDSGWGTDDSALARWAAAESGAKFVNMEIPTCVKCGVHRDRELVRNETPSPDDASAQLDTIG
jgi:hypothetical protein